ncbi:unnamed protein product [Polarella glacialis]|uniref:Uncharacterized protein n=1 Tax=Polarella glacialis TaxID=89957 RepID=A0A813J788_POLGL|nr:unnamed protein product [Polarella glacialis]
MPKLPFLSMDPYVKAEFAGPSAAEVAELYLFWEGALPYRTVIDTEQGGAVRELLKSFREALADDDFGILKKASLNHSLASNSPGDIERHARVFEQLAALGSRPRNVLDLGAHKGLWTKRIRRVFPESTFFWWSPADCS